MRSRAFTLIELLVVMAVIALLVGILLPALARSRRLAHATKCLANLHSLSQAVTMYADGNDGRLPNVGLAHGGSVSEGDAWINAASTEIGNAQVARCPSDESSYWNRPFPSTSQIRRLSYATNYYMTGLVEGKEEFNVMTRIKRPSTTVFWAELAEETAYAVADHFHPETWFADPLNLARQELHTTRHLGRSNYGFVDGHAEPARFEDLYTIDLVHSAFPDIAWMHNKFDPAVGW